MTALFALSNLNAALDGEPRLQDLLVGERLGYKNPTDIRQVIGRHRVELEIYGGLPQVEKKPVAGSFGGRPRKEYWLNEGQCILVCMFSRTERAEMVRRAVIEVFLAWRRGVAPEPGPFEDMPLGDRRLWVDAIALALRVHGRAAARRLWAASPLPKVGDPIVAPPADRAEPGLDPQGCWQRLMDWRPLRGDERTVAELLGLPERRLLRRHGVAADVKGWSGWLAVSTTHPALQRLFAGTVWRDLWPQALLGLPGARRHPSTVYFDTTTRAILIPLP
jgi:hypothetical protein